jgi:hypothetical protein
MFCTSTLILPEVTVQYPIWLLSAVFMLCSPGMRHRYSLNVSEMVPVMIIIIAIVCFPGVTTHCGRIFHSPVPGFSLLVFEVS